MNIFESGFYLFNVLLEISTIFIGLLAYKSTKKKVALAISVAFILSITSLLLASIELSSVFSFIPLLLRIIGYLIIISSLVFIYFKKILQQNNLSRIYYYLINYLLIFTVLFTIFSIYSCITFTFSIQNIISRSFLINFIFCLLISTISYIFYKILRKEIYLCIGIAFTFFALAHLIISVEKFEQFGILIFLSLLFGYLSIILALISLIFPKILISISKYLQSIKTQMIITIISLFLLIILFYFPNKKFNSADPKPSIKTIKPSPTEERLVEVKTGLFIKNFPVFDVTDNKFAMSGIVWFEFDPHQISLDIIDKFSFEKGTIIKKSEPETKIINEKLFVRYKITLEFKSNLDYQFFPIEDHNLYLVLTNTYLNPNEVVLTSLNNDLTLEKEIFTGDWNAINTDVSYGYLESEIDEYSPEKTSTFPAVLFNIFFEKVGIKNTLIIFVPMFVAFFLGLFSLILDISNKRGILSLIVGSQTLLVVGILSVIERLTPATSYFCLSDTIFTLVITCVFIMLLVNIIIVKKIPKIIFQRVIIFRSYIFLFFIIFILASVYYLLY